MNTSSSKNQLSQFYHRIPNELLLLARRLGSIDDHSVPRFTNHSKQIETGFTYLAIRGTKVDGHDFFREAIERGAECLVGDKPVFQIPVWARSIYLQVPDTRIASAYLASQYYKNPSHQLRLFGVTGTSGKTTNSYLLRSCLEAAGRKVGLIGTVGVWMGDDFIPSEYTTPDALELNRLFYEMIQRGCTDAVMEVSSHALKQHRTAFLAFDGMWFTNLSPEHLDYHPNMEDYFESKALLFTHYMDYAQSVLKEPVALIHTGDVYGQRLFEKLKNNHSQRVFDFSLNPQSAFSGSQLKLTLDGVSGPVKGPAVTGSKSNLPSESKSFFIQSNLVGEFNAQNLLGSAAMARMSGISKECVDQGIESLRRVPGRLDEVELPSSKLKDTHVYVDYAHKPDALEKVLVTLKKMQPGRLITIFGCGGDRDSSKRPLMGAIAERYSDWIVVTSDNPRTENPLHIIESILSGMPRKKPVDVEPDRESAIRKVINHLQESDVVLIAGKGHEDYQIIADPSQPKGTRKISFDDRAVALKAWKELR